MKILIAGDFCPQKRIVPLLEEGKYDNVLGNVQSIISDSTYSIINLECPITQGDERPIKKHGPNLRCSEAGIKALKWAGFKCVTLANNHFLDYGSKGVERTINTCSRYGIDIVGGGMNIKEAQKVLYKKIEDITIAIINVCEHEFSIATENTSGSNPLDLVSIYYDITEAKSKANFVIIIIHGGHEGYQLPSPRMKKLYRLFIDWGANIIINHHQHCYSGYENYQNGMIFYGLGNFCFDKYPKQIIDNWSEGYMVSLNIEKGNFNGFNLYPYTQCKGDIISTCLMTEREKEKFNIAINKLNQIIINDEELIKHFNNFADLNAKNYMQRFTPYTIGKVLKLYRLGILPSFMSKKKINRILNAISCESHRDIYMYLLSKIL